MVSWALSNFVHLHDIPDENLPSSPSSRFGGGTSIIFLKTNGNEPSPPLLVVSIVIVIGSPDIFFLLLYYFTKIGYSTTSSPPNTVVTEIDVCGTTWRSINPDIVVLRQWWSMYNFVGHRYSTLKQTTGIFPIGVNRTSYRIKHSNRLRR